MSKEIFKLQRPLFTTDKQPKMLVYNKDRSIFEELPLQMDLFEDAFKVYAEGEIVEIVESKFVLDKEVGEQDW